MTGVLKKKYHVAIMDNDKIFVTKVVNALKEWYNNRIVVRTFTNSSTMFEGINFCKANKCPFDLTVMNTQDLAEKMILKQTDPNMMVLLCKDVEGLKHETDKLVL